MNLLGLDLIRIKYKDKLDLDRNDSVALYHRAGRQEEVAYMYHVVVAVAYVSQSVHFVSDLR